MSDPPSSPPGPLEALQQLARAITPTHPDWPVKHLVLLAEAHREDSESIDRHSAGDKWGQTTDWDAVTLERKVAAQQREQELAQLKEYNTLSYEAMVNFQKQAERAEARVAELEREVARLLAENQTAIDVMCSVCDAAFAKALKGEGNANTQDPSKT